MGWVEKLKQRWGVQHTWRIIVILIIFSITGFTLIAIKPFILELVFQGEKPSGWMSVLYYLVSPLIYNILLLSYGTIFGQFFFFWNFEKKTFYKILSLFRKK